MAGVDYSEVELRTLAATVADCVGCESGEPREACPRSRRPCGHHCNHSWSHDMCHWCGEEWGEGG